MTMNKLKKKKDVFHYFTCPSLNQLDHYEYIKRMDFIKGSCLNQIDYYEYIKTMGVFHTPHA